MANFDEILANLHANAALDDADDAIIITPTRQFQVPEDYNLTVAYVGDVNSQIVTFKLPLAHEGHSLFDCAFKGVKWKNITSRVEGFSPLLREDRKDNGWTCQWEVPPEAMTQASNLEIAIVLYDLTEDNKIAFAWNTPVYKGFVVGETLADIGIMLGMDSIMPAADEILSINRETRMIVAPKGYNMTIANYGDIGITNVYFQVDKYVGGIDVAQSSIKINAKFNGDISRSIEDVSARPLTAQGNKVLIHWPVSANITSAIDEATNQPYTGQFTISVTFYQKGENGNLVKRWTSASFSGLTIAESLLTNDAQGFAMRNEQAVEEIIDKYLDENTFDIGYIEE